MSQLNRRNFVQAASLAAASPLARSMLGANDRIVVGLIGAGGMGRANLATFSKEPDVEVAAVCDVNQENLSRAVAMTEGRATSYADFRRLLDRKDLDAVIVATPDHWHALPTIYACQAGKDVYVEKPLALCIDEQQRMVRTARATKRVVQVGTMQRSGKHFQRAVEWIRAGRIGDVTFARTWIYDNSFPKGIGNPPDARPPSALDWDFWLGPAPKVPYNENRAAKTFRWFWDYSGGKLTDWGAHLIDIVQWALNVDGPRAVTAAGGKFVLKDNRETPDTLEVVYRYPGFLLNFSYRECNARGIESKDYGIEFHGTQGTLLLDRSGFEVFPEYDREGNEYMARVPAARVAGSEQYRAHARNFLDCIRSRALPNSDIEIGHRATIAPHLGNIAFRTDRKVEWDPVAERLMHATHDQEALLARQYRKPWMLPGA